MNSYLRMEAARLPTLVGTSSPKGFLTSTGQAGVLSYGPYISLDAGRYVAGFYARRIGTPEPINITLDVFVDGSEVAAKSISHQSLFEDLASFVYLTFELPGPAVRVECRMHVGAGALIELRELAIFKADQRTWSVA